MSQFSGTIRSMMGPARRSDATPLGVYVIALLVTWVPWTAWIVWGLHAHWGVL